MYHVVEYPLYANNYELMLKIEFLPHLSFHHEEMSIIHPVFPTFDLMSII